VIKRCVVCAAISLSVLLKFACVCGDLRRHRGLRARKPLSGARTAQIQVKRSNSTQAVSRAGADINGIATIRSLISDHDGDMK
jgi:hypothetical protein